MLSEEGVKLFASFRGTYCANWSSLSTVQLVDSSGWATILAVIWLHDNGKDLKCEWELLERKAVAWMRAHAGRSTILRPASFPFPGLAEGDHKRVPLSPASTILLQIFTNLPASFFLGGQG